MTRVLFADLLQPKLDVAKEDGKGTYWSELQGLVARHAACPPDWVRFDTNWIRRERQYEKSEQVITYYLLAALSLATDQFRQTETLRTLLARGFRSPCSVDESVRHVANHGWGGLRYEAQICPSDEQRKAIQANGGAIPIAYLREMIAQQKPRIRFESPTHLDAFIGDQGPLIDGGGEVGLGFEAKFTSDIDSHTTYSPHRNQLIRNIEVGNGRFARFYFVLIAPRMYFERRSRFYVYKADEYRGDQGVAALQRDSLVRPTDQSAKEWQERFGVLVWEDIVEIVFPGGQPGFDHPDAADLGDFLRQRGLL